MATVAERVQLKPETLQAFDAYVLAAETAMDDATRPEHLLWSEQDPERLKQARKGAVVTGPWAANSKDPVTAPHGLIHDWIGAAFVPGRTVPQALAVVQDYANHKTIYKPDVMDSGIVSHSGDDFQVYLRFLKKKIITVVLDTYHDVHYSSPDPTRASCRSHTTQIFEVEHAGTPKETRSAPDTGYGFMWRLNSYWRFEEKEGGTFIECRAISLTRDVPTALAWAIHPIVRKLPKESLVHTLEATRKAVASLAATQQPERTEPATP